MSGRRGLAHRVDATAAEAAQGVASSQDPQGSVVGVAVVEMEADRQHGREEIGGRFDMSDTCLHRPGAKALPIMTFHDGYRQVLVPENGPIGLRRLVEEEGANGDGVQADDRLDEPADARIGRQNPHFGDIQQVARAVDGAGAALSAVAGCCVQNAP